MKLKHIFLALALVLPLWGLSAEKLPGDYNYLVEYELPGFEPELITARTIHVLENEPGFDLVTELFENYIPAKGRLKLEESPGEVGIALGCRVRPDFMLVRVTDMRLINEEGSFDLEGPCPDGMEESAWKAVVEESDLKVRKLLAHVADAFLDETSTLPSEVVVDYVLSMPVGLRPAEDIIPVKVQMLVKKPVIYLYPEVETEVQVKVDFAGSLDFLWPKYDEEAGWKVLAHPNGLLTDLRDDSRHRYLFWEGTSDDPNWETEKGFCVRGSESANFLAEILPELGLEGQEINDFITFWAPQMQANPWNLIQFPHALYETRAQLNISPQPETLIRVFMTYRRLNSPIPIQEPHFSPPKRTGFVAVEWGGIELPELVQEVSHSRSLAPDSGKP